MLSPAGDFFTPVFQLLSPLPSPSFFLFPLFPRTVMLFPLRRRCFYYIDGMRMDPTRFPFSLCFGARR